MKCTCSVYANEPSRSCSVHGLDRVKQVNLLSIHGMIDAGFIHKETYMRDVVKSWDPGAIPFRRGRIHPAHLESVSGALEVAGKRASVRHDGGPPR